MKSIKFPQKSIVLYHGGGYDGCIWEWNVSYVELTEAGNIVEKDGWFYINDKCIEDEIVEYDPFVISGVLGAKTMRDLLCKIEKSNDDDYEIIDINDNNALIEMAGEYNKTLVYSIADFLQYEDIVVEAKCGGCGEYFPVANMFMEGFHAIGGIASDYNDFICEDCHNLNSCGYCGTYHENLIQYPNGRCEYCADKKHSPTVEDVLRVVVDGVADMLQNKRRQLSFLDKPEPIKLKIEKFESNAMLKDSVLETDCNITGVLYLNEYCGGRKIGKHYMVKIIESDQNGCKIDFFGNVKEFNFSGVWQKY